jgi:hypothetical protein
MSNLMRLSLVALLAVSMAVFAAPAASAQQSSTRSVDSPRYDVDIQVQDGGSLVVQ